MAHTLSLRGRIFVLLLSLCLISVVGGGVMIWYTYRMDRIFTRTVEGDVAASEAVEELLHALIMQKGFVSYYFMDEDPAWLERLEEYREAFRLSLDKAERLAATAQDGQVLQKVRQEYERYIGAKDRVIDLYRAGERERGRALHKEVRANFFELLSLCETYDESHNERIRQAHLTSQKQAGKVRLIAASAILVVMVLSMLFAFVLFTQILVPIQRLATEAGRFEGPLPDGNEMKALRRGVRNLIEDAGQTHVELEKSRVKLLQTEKMATVGKLAAGVAHSIRNPMTSIKMRLFSLERGLRMSPTQKEDLEVISEEIRHIDNIVQNFLQYSRPAKLKMQNISTSEIIDMSLQLLRHRFKSYGIEVETKRDDRLPRVSGDPDQLKEMFVNLLVNACEAMPEGGRIHIQETTKVVAPTGPMLVVSVRDNGPGIPKEIQEKVFEPFFSTKEEGTGLGLSIAVRIVNQHNGFLNLKSTKGEGTVFTIALPCGED